MFVMLALVVAPASANVIEDILDMKFVDTACELVHDRSYRPEKNVQHSRHIHGWIDVVGFKNMARIDGKYYISGNPAGNTIVRYDTWNTADGWNRAVDTFEETVTTTQHGNYVTAKMDIYLLWHSVRFDPFPYPHVVTTYHTERATFKDTELIPNIFTSLNYGKTYLDVVIYNNTLQPKTTIRVVDYPENILAINYSYANKSTVHYLGVAATDYTPKNVAYMDIKSINVWGGDMTYFNEFVIIPTANFTETNLTVTCSDPYQEVEITNCTITNVTYTGIEGSISSLFWVVIMLVCVFLLAAGYLITRF